MSLYFKRLYTHECHKPIYASSNEEMSHPYAELQADGERENFQSEEQTRWPEDTVKPWQVALSSTSTQGPFAIEAVWSFESQREIPITTTQIRVIEVLISCKTINSKTLSFLSIYVYTRMLTCCSRGCFWLGTGTVFWLCGKVLRLATCRSKDSRSISEYPPPKRVVNCFPPTITASVQAENMIST